MTILVTGAAGFLGRHIVSALSSSARDVRTVTLPGEGGDIEADLTDVAGWWACDLPQVDQVIHAAAVLPGDNDAQAANVAMAEAFAQAAEGVPLSRVVLLSSVSVYGSAEVPSWGPFSREPEPGAYGRSKARAEQALRAAFAEKLRVLRPTSIGGAGQTLRSVLPVLIEQAQSGEPLRLFGPRTFVQNFIAVNDVANIVVAALDGGPDVVDVCSDQTLDVLSLAHLVKDVLQSSSEIVDERTDEPWGTAAYDPAMARSLLGRAFTPLADVIRAVGAAR